MAERSASCAERLPEYLDGRIADMRSIVGWAQAWGKSDRHKAEDRYETALERWDEYPLAISPVRSVKVELSYGGPQDYLLCFIDEDGGIERIEYHFLDWFDGASVDLTGRDFEVASEFCQHFVDLIEWRAMR